MISVKARWERWCSLKLWPEGSKCTKKSIFFRTESVAMTPKSRDHIPTTSLWGVAAKWLTRAFFCPRNPQGYSHISFSLSGRILKEYRNIVSASKQTPCGISWGLRNHSHWSARYTNGRDKSFILPLFDYADIIWDNYINTQSNMLENHLEVIRIITGSVRGTSHQKLYKESGFCTLKERRKRHKLIQFHKMRNSTCPDYLSDLLPLLVSTTNPYHRRRPYERIVPSFRTEL